MIFGHNFRLGGPIDTRLMRLNCILHDLFRDTPLDHIWHAQIRAQIWPITITRNTVFGARIWARQILTHNYRRKSDGWIVSQFKD